MLLNSSIIIIFLMLVNILVCTVKGYKKGFKYALFNLVMLFAFYTLFLALTIIIDKIDFSFLLINIKYFFNIDTDIYDSLINLISSIVVRIIVFFLLCLLYPIIKHIMFKFINRNKKPEKSKKGAFIGIIKGLISSFLMLCIINSTISIIPKLNKNNEESLYQIVLDETENDPKVKMTLDIIDDYQNSKLLSLSKIKIREDNFDDLFLSTLSKASVNGNYSYINEDIKNILLFISNIYIQSAGFTQFEKVDLKTNIDIIKDNNLLDYFSPLIITTILKLDSLKEYLPNIDLSMYDAISLKEELNTISIILQEVNATDIDYDKVAVHLSNLKSIELIGYILSYNILNDYFTTTEMVEIESTLLTLVKEKSFSKDVLIVDELYEAYLNILNKKNIKYNANVIILKLLETNFTIRLLPSIIDKAISYLPYEYQSLIDTNTINYLNIKDEFNTILSILNILFIDKGDEMAFDFSMIKKLSIDGVLKSELLSHGFIKMLIDASNNKGLLKKYSNFIDLPSYLKEYDKKTKKYHSLWYGKDGELSIILQVVKSALVSIEKKNSDNENIVNVINCLNTDISYKSEVLYYSFNKILKNIDVISVKSEDLVTVDNQYFISKVALKNFINTLCNFNLINYYKAINNDYVNMFEYTNINNLTNQIDLMLNNNIVHCSLSYAFSHIKEITLCDNVSYKERCLNNNEIKDIDIISKKELKNILLLIINMKLDLNNFNNVDSLLNSLKANKNILQKALSPLDSSYSYILHYNISNAILSEIKKITDLDTSKIINKYPTSLIDGKEIIELLNTLILLNSNDIIITELSKQEVDQLSKFVIHNNEILNSFIVKELLFEYINKYSQA